MPLRFALILAAVVAAAGLTVGLGYVFGGFAAESGGTALAVLLLTALLARLALFRHGGGK